MYSIYINVYLHKKEAYTNDTFSNYVDDMSSKKLIPTTCCLYKVVGIAPSLKVEKVVGIDVVGTEPPMPTTSHLQRVVESEFRGKKVLL